MSNNNIVAQPSEICTRTFHGWKNIPENFKTRAAWKRDFHRVAKGGQATAIVIIEETRRFDSIDSDYTVEKSYKLFHSSQTQAIEKTPLNTAQHEFYEHFGKHADRSRLIRWTKGQ